MSSATRSLFAGTYMFEIGKVGLDSRGGWIAFANTATGYAFVQRFGVEPDGDYPDAGADIECWTVGRGHVATLTYDENSGPFLMETEVLGPFRDIAPAATASLDIEWGACRCAGPVLDVTEAGCVSRHLAVAVEAGQAMLTGIFGVFDVGRLELIWLDGEGAGLTGESLEPVTPLARGAVGLPRGPPRASGRFTTGCSNAGRPTPGTGVGAAGRLTRKNRQTSCPDDR